MWTIAERQKSLGRHLNSHIFAKQNCTTQGTLTTQPLLGVQVSTHSHVQNSVCPAGGMGNDLMLPQIWCFYDDKYFMKSRSQSSRFAFPTSFLALHSLQTHKKPTAPDQKASLKLTRPQPADALIQGICKHTQFHVHLESTFVL